MLQKDIAESKAAEEATQHELAMTRKEAVDLQQKLLQVGRV